MSIEDFIAARSAWLIDHASRVATDPAEWPALIAGLVAGVLILISAVVKTIIPLRWLAVAANIGFVIYGALQPAPMVLVLHAALLPINLWRVLEMHRLTRRIARASSLSGPELGAWLQPYMKRRRLRPGTVLFRKGDRADRLYMLAEGRLEIPDLGRTIEAGQMFGEIAFFAPEGRRTATVQALEPSTVLSIDETTFRQLYFQNPAFGWEVVRLIAARLSDDVRRLQALSADGPVPVPVPVPTAGPVHAGSAAESPERAGLPAEAPAGSPAAR